MSDITPSLKVKYCSSDILQQHHGSFMSPQVTSAGDIDKSSVFLKSSAFNKIIKIRVARLPPTWKN